MKKILLFFPLLFFFMLVNGQGPHYFYFESEGKLPFYVKMNDRLFASSAPGYLVLPNLPEGKYTVFVGVSSGGRKESRFEVDLASSDRGFRIRKVNDEYILQDLSSGTMINPYRDQFLSAVTYERREDAFTLLLAKASNDPGLVMVPVLPKNDNKKPVAVAASKPEKEQAGEAVVSEAVAVVPAQDSGETEVVAVPVPKAVPDTVIATAIIFDSTAEKPGETVQPVASPVIDKFDSIASPIASFPSYEVDADEPFVRSTVTRYAEASVNDGFMLTFIDQTSRGSDTIRITIPNPRFILAENMVNEDQGLVMVRQKAEEVQAATTDTLDKADKKPEVEVEDESVQKPVEEAKKLLPEVPDTAPPAVVIEKPDTSVSTSPVVVVKPVGLPAPAKNCRSVAGESDFFKLRKNMATRTSDEAMVEEAKKAFRARCYTSEQVRHLSALFLTSAGKYIFFDAAFGHISDPENFAGLGSEIKDDYYLRRFRALIGE